MDIPQFHTREELFKWLKANKGFLIQQKKATLKKADAVNSFVPLFDKDGSVMKAEQAISADISSINAKLIINTTGLMDSHSDVHIKGLWKKSLQEKKNAPLLQEHSMTFQGIISTEVKASVVDYTWKELGFNYEGTTQALQFDAIIGNQRNPYMFDQYRKQYVTNHSVGMQYVTLYMCINSEEKYYVEEKEYWDKYIKQVVNKEDAEAQGYFWAVTEAKFVEGSAVVLGSNYATPVYSITESAGAGKSTPSDTEPPIGTQTKSIYSFLNENYDK